MLFVGSCFSPEVACGSSHPCLISHWLSDIDLATSMVDLDHSRFAVRQAPHEFKTLDSKIAKGIMEIILADFKRKINFLEETQYNNKRSRLSGREIVYPIISFFNINKTKGHTMNWNDLRNVEF